MPARRGLIGQRQRPRLSADQNRLIGQLKSAAFIRALQDKKGDHEEKYTLFLRIARYGVLFQHREKKYDNFVPIKPVVISI